MKELDFKRFLKDKTWDYSKETIEQLMEEELQKEPEDINMEFIDACMSYLTDKCAEAPAKVEVVRKTRKAREIRVKPKRLLSAAVAAVLCFTLSITAFAASGYIDIPFVSLFAGHAAIDYFEKGSSDKPASVKREDSALYKELSEGGISDIFLPSQLYDMKHKELKWQNDDVMKMVGVNYSDNDIMLVIQTFTDQKWVMNPNIMGKGMTCEMINVNGVDVYLFEETGTFSWQTKTTISYEIGLTQFSINTKMTMSEAKEFIKNMN